MYPETDTPGTTWLWKAAAIAADGAVREIEVDMEAAPVGWYAVVDTHPPDFSSFNLSGTMVSTNTGGWGRRISITWRYDAGKKRYLGTPRDPQGGR